MKRAPILKENDHYKDGFIKCACGWRKELGDGFHQTKIGACPSCTPELDTRTQRKVIYWDKGRSSLRADVGNNVYFITESGVHIRYKAAPFHSYGTERQLEAI